MGLSNQSSNTKYVRVVYENGNKDTGAPSFGIMSKTNDAWSVAEQGNNLSGKITGIEKDSYDYRGKQQYKVKIIVEDKGESFSLELGYGYYSRNVLNSLAGVGDLAGKEIKFSIYRNKDGYVTIYTTSNGDTVDWSLDGKTLPNAEDPKWLPSFDHFINQIKGCLAPSETSDDSFSEVDDSEEKAAAGASEKTPPPIEEGNNEVDDLPF